jgi:hypothetical protein
MMRFLLLASVAATLALATPAHADDFTFTVPIRIENMTHAENVRVSCDLIRDSGLGMRTGVGSTGQIAVPLVAGRYVGTLTLPVTVSGAGYTAADATHWGCNITYRWRMPDGTLFNRSLRLDESRAVEYERYTGQHVASTVDHVDGAVPR